jgi:hypothetical protein
MGDRDWKEGLAQSEAESHPLRSLFTLRACSVRCSWRRDEKD